MNLILINVETIGGSYIKIANDGKELQTIIDYVRRTEPKQYEVTFTNIRTGLELHEFCKNNGIFLHFYNGYKSKKKGMWVCEAIKPIDQANGYGDDEITALENYLLSISENDEEN